MRYLVSILGIILLLLVACEAKIPEVSPMPVATGTPTLTTEEQKIIAIVGARYESGFYSGRADCVRAIDRGTTKQCVFPVGIELLTTLEWKQLLPNTTFYLVDIGSWRSFEGLLPHEGQDGGVGRQIVAWQNAQSYQIESFDHLLEDNAIIVNDINRELVARSFALMSIPNYLGGDVIFLEWKPVKPGVYRHNYSHLLKAWTEIWGCEVYWSFVFNDDKITIVSLSGGACRINEYGNYTEDRRYFEFGDAAAVPLGAPPYFQDYFFNR
jgi:hypothetical protein